MKNLFSILFLLLITLCVSAQNIDLWQELDTDTNVSDSKNSKQVNRKKLNQEALRQLLSEVEHTGYATITIPHPTGTEMSFNIRLSYLMAAELQEKHPEIQTLKGYNEKGDLVRMDINPQGIHATIYTEGEPIYLTPDGEGYKSYFASEKTQTPDEGITTCIEEEIPQAILSQKFQSRTTHPNSGHRTIGTEVRKYRMAVTAHATFTNRTGGSDHALSTIVTILNRATGFFEREVAVTFELIANNDLLIMTPSSPGPFSSSGVAELLRTENQDFVDDVIGEENYDLGQIVGGSGSGGGGIASFRSVCVSGRKAATATSFLFTIGNLDPFINTFIHEVGHQFGAFHTFTSGASCSFGVSNFHQRAAYEIGSGSSIMSYAGFCGANNVESSFGNYFHAISIENILDFIEGEDNCSESIPTGNTPPSVSISEGGFTIPINTPFMLEATGSDEDNDDLTYSWEQLDQATKMENRPGTPYSHVSEISYFSVEEFMNGDEYETREELENLVLEDGSTLPEHVIEFVLSQQQEYIDAMFEGDGPLFRSFPPATYNKRYFPSLSKILAGETSIQESVFEVLPFKTRDLNFMITVRDNNPNGGGVTNDLISFSATEEAGPFIVTTELSEPSYNGLSDIELEWDVANTDLSPISCQNVDILYSTDGGENFSITLLENTPNDGAETIKLPNIETSKARLMVKAAGNIFFHVNKNDFNVLASEVDIPEAPSALEGNRLNDNTVQLSWTDNDDLEDGFTIERQSGSGSGFEVITQVSVNVTSYADESAKNDESYTYRVGAFNQTGISAYSNTTSIESTDLPDTIVTSTNDVASDLRIYPNPTSNLLYINATDHLVFIHDLLGRQVEKTVINGAIDVSELSKGVYFITTPQQQFVQFIKT